MHFENVGLFINAAGKFCQSFVNFMPSVVVTVAMVVTVSLFDQIKTTPRLEAIMILWECVAEQSRLQSNGI